MVQNDPSQPTKILLQFAAAEIERGHNMKQGVHSSSRTPEALETEGLWLLRRGWIRSYNGLRFRRYAQD